MTLYNSSLYDTSQYNAWDIIPYEYDTTDTGVDFGDGFKVPNAFVNINMLGYLDPLSASYSTPRVTQRERRFTNVQKGEGEIIVQGYIQGTDRANLIEKVEYFKAKVEGKRTINFKDAGVEKTAKVYCTIKFDEHSHSVTVINFEVTCRFLDYVAYAENIDLLYSGKTGASETFSFYNNGKETDLLGILTYNSGSSLDVTVSVNGKDLIIDDVGSGDVVLIDTDGISVKKNGGELVFGGVLSKLVP